MNVARYFQRKIMKTLLTTGWWADALERSIRAAAASALGMLGADQIGLLTAPWATVGSVAGMAALVSLLTSIAAGKVGPPTAGFTNVR